MICPHDNRAYGVPPRCAPCPLVHLSEDDALAALFAVAALSGGTVNDLWRMSMGEETRHFGYVVLSGSPWPTVPVWVWQAPLWVWQRERGLYGPVLIHEISTNIYPGGRVDRGLGAIQPGTKTAPGTDLASARGGDQAPTD